MNMKKSKISKNTIIMDISELKRFLENKILVKSDWGCIKKINKEELKDIIWYKIYALPKRCKLKPMGDYTGEIYDLYIGNKFFTNIKGCWSISYNRINRLFYLTKTWKKI